MNAAGNEETSASFSSLLEKAFGKPHLDDDGRLEALDGLRREYICSSFSSLDEGEKNALESALKNALKEEEEENSALVLAKCFSLLTSLSDSSSSLLESMEREYERMCVIPTRAFNKSANNGGEEENVDVKRVLFALDCCG